MEFEDKDSYPFVSVVMTLFNMERTIGECLESLIDLDYQKDRYEIIIVDGESTDTTRDIIEDYANKHTRPQIKLYVKKGYIGVGRNEAVKHAKGEFIAITDGDMVVSREWIKELLKGFEDETIVGVGGPNNSAESGLSKAQPARPSRVAAMRVKSTAVPARRSRSGVDSQSRW